MSVISGYFTCRPSTSLITFRGTTVDLIRGLPVREN